MWFLRVKLDDEENIVASESGMDVLTVTLYASLSEERGRKFGFDVGALSEDKQYVRWVKDRELHVGNRVMIELGEGEVESSVPVEVKPGRSDAARERSERRAFEAARETYFRLKEKYETDDSAGKMESE